MVQNLGNNTIMPVEETLINPADKFIFKIGYFYQSPPPECAKGNPPCPFMPQRINFKAGQSIGEDMVKGMSIPMDVLALNPIAVASKSGETGARPQAKDPWTGGVDWSNVFNFRNLFWTVVVVVLIYLFLKKVLPVIKQSIK